MMIDDLKQGALLQIDDTIETLQLRILLNEQTIRNGNIHKPDLQRAIEFAQTMKSQDRHAIEVIKECKKAIAKLTLLKKHFLDLPFDSAVSLLNNYENYTLEKFRTRLNLKLTTE